MESDRTTPTNWIPIELWQMILYSLSFEDQLNCRSVCKYWCHLISSYSGFKSKYLLKLENCVLSEDKAPLTDLQNSTLEFKTVVAHSSLKMIMSPAIPMFLAQLGETVTYLDISDLWIGTDGWKRCEAFVDNLHLFKVLHHFNVGLIGIWFKVVIKRTEAELEGNDLKRRNTSVRVFAFDVFDENFTVDKLNLILALLPNVEEFHVSGWMESHAYLLADLYPEKIVKLNIRSDLYTVQRYNLPNLKHLDLVLNENNQETLKQVVEKFPQINSIRVETRNLPTNNFQYFTEIQLVLFENSMANTLRSFKNLKTFDVTIGKMVWRNDDAEGDFCFLGHEPFKLDSLQVLRFISHHSKSYCQECFDNFLQSFPNLCQLEYVDYSNMKLDSIFNFQPNLVELSIRGCKAAALKTDWPVMKNLRKLVMSFPIEGSKEDWHQFGRKLINLKHLGFFFRTEYDLMDIIGDNMPLLRRVDGLDRNKKKPSKEILTETVTRNGKTIKLRYF